MLLFSYPLRRWSLPFLVDRGRTGLSHRCIFGLTSFSFALTLVDLPFLPSCPVDFNEHIQVAPKQCPVILLPPSSLPGLSVHRMCAIYYSAPAQTFPALGHRMVLAEHSLFIVDTFVLACSL